LNSAKFACQASASSRPRVSSAIQKAVFEILSGQATESVLQYRYTSQLGHQPLAGLFDDIRESTTEQANRSGSGIHRAFPES
jgi:hypothetical protein